MIVDCAIYENGRRRDGTIELEHAYRERGHDGNFVWIGLHEPTHEEFDSLTREFSLHPLAVEDAVHAHQRPKLEVFGDVVFLVLKTARYVDSDEVVELGELLIFVGHDFVITVRHGEATPLTAVREELEHRPERLRHGPGAVLHAILDRVVDDYGPATDGLQTDIEEVEAELFSSERSNPAQRIYRLQREVLEFRRGTATLVDPLDRLAAGRVAHVPEEICSYFRDVNDHLIRTRDLLDGMRDLLQSSLQANLAQVTVRQNDDMRRISAWIAIVAVPTMLAGIYGMNFDDMPELSWGFGYPLVLGVMLVACSILFWRFKRAGWL